MTVLPPEASHAAGTGQLSHMSHPANAVIIIISSRNYFKINAHVDGACVSVDHYLFHGYIKDTFCDLGLCKLLCVLELDSDTAIILLPAIHRPVTILQGSD